MGLLVAKNRELVELTVLGLLRERPRHPYDMQRQLRTRGNTMFVRGLPRSLYHAVETLLQQGHVETVEVSRVGARPERTVYAATASGRREYRERLLHLLATPSAQMTFFAAISLVAGLSASETAEALRERAESLRQEIARGTAILESMTSKLPRLVLIEAEYLLHQTVAELEWVEQIAAEAESGELSWKLDFPPHRLCGDPPE